MLILLRLGLLVALSGDGYSAPPVEPEVIQAEAAVPVGPAPVAPVDCGRSFEVRTDTPPAPAARSVLVEVIILEKYQDFNDSLRTP